MAYNALQYRDWILEQEGNYKVIKAEDSYALTFDTEKAVGNINFHIGDIVGFEDITEMSISLKETGENRFYLHFQANKKEHSEELFREMIQTIEDLNHEKIVKVTLTCSCGLTTSFFASALNESAESLGLKYSFNAVNYTGVIETAKDSDVILVAPQIGFEYEKLKTVFPEKIVIKVPAAIFAGYKTVEMVNVIHEELNKAQEIKESKPEPVTIREVFENDRRVLTIGSISNYEECRFSYRIYDHGKVTADGIVIKKKFAIEDLDDLIHYVMHTNERVNAICIAVPHVTNHGKMQDITDLTTRIDVAARYEGLYDVKVYLCNDVNAMALGYYAMHEDCENMLFYQHGVLEKVGRAGLVINGEVYRGYHSYAGQLTPFVNTMIPDAEELRKTTDGTEELITKQLLTYIVTVAPKKIVIYSRMIHDVNKIRENLVEKIGEQFVPEIIMADGVKRFLLPGLMIYALERLKKK